MKQDLLLQSQMSDSKRKRRKRTDDQGRDYVCECGKSYLSYPALYTHMKTKHPDQPMVIRGRNPEQSFDNTLQGIKRQLNQSQQQKQKQKIPSMNYNEPKQPKQPVTIMKEQPKQVVDQPSPPITHFNFPQVNNIQALQQYLKLYFPNFAIKTGIFRNQLIQSDRNELKQIKQYWQFRKKEQQPYDQVYLTPVNKVVGKFIKEMEQNIVSVSLRKYLLFIFSTIKNAIIKIKDQQYWKQHSAAYLPSLFNQILKEYFLTEQNQYISHPTLSTKTSYYFCRWLYVNKFTNLSLKYNF